MTQLPTARWMERALKSARTGMQRGEGGPFGACIVKGNRVLAVAHNTVLKNQDATCHAEINAIRIASRKLKSFDLSGCLIYSTTEPCPMCFSAIHWARLGEVIFGTRIEDVKKLGFNELRIPNQEMKRAGKSPVRICAGFLRRECQMLLREWRTFTNRRVY